MPINRHNYEEYFLLYTDDELSIRERQAVEEFVAANPELSDELALLQQYKLVPEKMVFTGKKSLMKIAGDHFIHTDNYEEYFLLYADNELNGHLKSCVEQFVQDHPALKESFDLIQKAVVTPGDDVRFPDKRLLRRREDKIIPLAWWKAAAAAAAVVLIAGALWLGSQSSVQRFHPPVALQQNSPAKQKPVSAEKLGSNGSTVYPASAGSVAKKAEAARKTVQLPQNTSVPDNGREQATRMENRPQPQIAAVTETVDATRDIVVAGKISAAVIQEQNLVIEEAVTFPGTDLSDNDLTDSGVVFASEGDADDAYVTNLPISNKHALRGLFRKASRIINKATTLNTGEKGIHIGNVEIAMR